MTEEDECCLECARKGLAECAPDCAGTMFREALCGLGLPRREDGEEISSDFQPLTKTLEGEV